MAYRELELTLLSARDLKNVNLITRMDVYAVVTISGDPLTRQCTAPDPFGGGNPRWDATLRFAVPPTAAAAAGACLHVLLRAERVLGDRDVGEVIVPLADLLQAAGAPTSSGSGPQQPRLASYPVRKVHRWEPRGVLNVSYRLGPVVAPVAAELQEKPPVVMAYPVAVPSSQSPRPAADAYPPPPSPPRPAAMHAAKHEEAPAPAPAPPQQQPRNGKSNGLGREGPTQVCVGPHTQIILGAQTGPLPTGTMTMSPARSNNSPRKPDGARPKQDLHRDDDAGAYAPTQPIMSPRKEDSRPKMLSQHYAQARVTAAVPPSKEEPWTSPRPPSRHPPASTFSSRSSSASSSSPYSSGYSFAISPCSSAHSSAPSPYSSTHRSTPSPRSPSQPAARDGHGDRAISPTTNSPYSASTPRATR